MRIGFTTALFWGFRTNHLRGHRGFKRNRAEEPKRRANVGWCENSHPEEQDDRPVGGGTHRFGALHLKTRHLVANNTSILCCSPGLVSYLEHFHPMPSTIGQDKENGRLHLGVRVTGAKD